MLRAYQLSSSANRSLNDSSSPWTLKDRNDNQDTNVRTRTVSTRILGLGIVLVGVLALAVGLIMGLEFPKYVYEKNKEAQCVLHVDHENYRSWQSGSQWKRKVKVYYWIITNEEGFLYRSEKPEFIQRGPYIYTETVNKYDIRFAVTEVSFRKRIKYTFDLALTKTDCTRCQESDKLTIINPWYLQRVFTKGGENQLAWESIPKYVTINLANQGLATLDEDSSQILVFHQNISLLGDFNKQTMVTTSSPLSNVSFGTWFSSNTDAFSNVITFINGSTQFSNSEVLAIYNVFTNSTLLYGSIYSNEVDVKDIENSLHAKCEEWANSVCSDHRRRASIGVELLQCGVVYILHKCHENEYGSSEVYTYLHSVFCPNDDVCLNFSSMSEDVAFEFRKMLSLFLIQLTSNVYVNVLHPKFYNLVITHNQSSFALGFQFDSNEYVSSYSAKGLLYQDRNSDNRLWNFYTCLKNREMKNNMKIKEYGGLQHVPRGIFTPQPSRPVSLTSYTDFARPCSKLHACVDCDSSEEYVDVFVEDLVRPVAFLNKGRSSIDGVSVIQYEISNTTFTNTSSDPGVTGVQDVTPFVGFLAWVGPPKVDAVHGYSPSAQPEPSFVQVEPVTGRMWIKNIKLQWNVGVGEELSTARGRSISGDFVSVPLPITWYQRVMTLSDDETDEYERLVIRLMNAACGGLIAFSVIAAVIALIGLVICVYPFKPNKVIPVFDEALNNNVNSRH